MKYLKVLACKALFREISYYAARSENIIDVSYYEWGLHDKVGALNEVLKEEIARIDSGTDLHTSYPPYGLPFDGILLGYGLCSNGVVGLSSEKYPLVIPRAHDCITLLLGSKERYQEVFAQDAGTYWYTPGWVESSPLPGNRERDWMIKTYTEKYGEKKAVRMVDMYEMWQDNYTHLGLIEWPEFEGTGFAQVAQDEARDSAAYANFEFKAVQGDSGLLQRFLSGDWNDEEFLVVPPGETVKPSYDDKVIKY